MALEQGQLITYALDEVEMVFSELSIFQEKAQKYEPDPATMSRSSNIYWKPLQQNGNPQDGWDLTGQEDDVLELSISGSLGEPTSTYRTLRMDEMRDERGIRRAMNADARALMAEIEYRGLAKAATHGSFCLPYAEAAGPESGQIPVWDALASAETRMFDTEMYTDMGTCSFLNGTTYRAGGKALVEGSARRSTDIQDEAYRDGKIQEQIAGFSDVYRHNKLFTLPAAQGGAVAASSTVSLKPEANEDLANGSKGNVDNRFGVIPVDSVSGIAVGDKFRIDGVKAIALGTNGQVLDYDQTFTVAAVGASDITVSPRPIAKDDGSLTDLEKRYANINTQIQANDTLIWLNTTEQQTNIVMATDAMVLVTNPIPFSHEMFQQLDCRSFSAGPIQGLIGFEASLGQLTGKYRMAIWFDWQVERPEAVGPILFNQS